jgi:hypothetical protein
VMLECPGGSSSSAAPLEWGNIGYRRAVHVTGYGSDAPCGACLPRDLDIGKWSTTSTTRNILINSLCLRGWVYLNHGSVQQTHQWPPGQ